MYSRQTAITAAAVICLVTGLVVGAIAAMSRGEAEQAALFADLAAHFLSLAHTEQAATVLSMLQHTVGNLLFALIIWLLAFARAAGFLSYPVVFLQGISYGFTTAILAVSLDLRDVLAALLVYLPQAVLTACALLYVCANSISYICLTHNGRRHNYGEAALRRYAKVLAVAVFVALAASAMDIYLAPIAARRLNFL